MTPLHESASFWPFLILTVVFGGWCARIAGRSFAASWKPVALLPVVLLPLALGVRFLHYALFDGTLLSLHYFTADYAIVMIFSVWGYLTHRSELMAGLYPFAFQRYGLIAWREKR